MKVLIDGENLRHQLAYVLFAYKKIRSKNDYFGFNLMSFLQEAMHEKKLEVVYYTTRVKYPQGKVPVAFKKTIEAINNANRRWVADLVNQNITVIKAGYLRVRESNTCIHCNKKTLVLQEKGVDVRVATDLVRSKDTDKQIALVSSDSDLTPALEATKKAGVYIYYLCYAAWLNRSVASQVHKTLTYDDTLVLKYFVEEKS